MKCLHVVECRCTLSFFYFWFELAQCDMSYRLMCLFMLSTQNKILSVGEFKIYAHIDVNSGLKLSIGNEFANGINSRYGVTYLYYYSSS